MKMSLKVGLLLIGAIMISSVNSEEINYITRFLYNPVSAWGDNIVFGKRECPDYTPVKPFRMDKLVGEWYVMHRSESNLDENGLCTVKSFTVN